MTQSHFGTILDPQMAGIFWSKTVLNHPEAIISGRTRMGPSCELGISYGCTISLASMQQGIPVGS